MADTPPDAPPPSPQTQFDFGKISDNLFEAGACLQSLAAKAQLAGEVDYAQELSDRADFELDTATFLRSLIGIV